jgi:hypothetical protein
MIGGFDGCKKIWTETTALFLLHYSENSINVLNTRPGFSFHFSRASCALSGGYIPLISSSLGHDIISLQIAYIVSNTTFF